MTRHWKSNPLILLNANISLNKNIHVLMFLHCFQFLSKTINSTNDTSPESYTSAKLSRSPQRQSVKCNRGSSVRAQKQGAGHDVPVYGRCLRMTSVMTLCRAVMAPLRRVISRSKLKFRFHRMASALAASRISSVALSTHP